MTVTIHMRRDARITQCGLSLDRVDYRTGYLPDATCGPCQLRCQHEAEFQEARVRNAQGFSREHWFRVSGAETLPPHTKNVLTWARHFDSLRIMSRDEYGTGWWYPGGHQTLGGNAPTHWRELPEGPQP